MGTWEGPEDWRGTKWATPEELAKENAEFAARKKARQVSVSPGVSEKSGTNTTHQGS